MGGGYAEWLDKLLIEKVEQAYWKAIDYILAAQIIVEGKKTAWAQQYIEYAPAQGRIYEIPAIASLESRNIISLLMRVENPSQRIQQAITAAVSWADLVKVVGFEYARIQRPEYAGRVFVYQIKSDPAATQTREYRYTSDGTDKVLRVSSGENVIWARLYSLDTMQPIFSDWEGEVKTILTDVQYERRVGYNWYGNWLSSFVHK